MPNNSDNLRLAHKAKNDEFYTRLEDIEKELVHYRNFFKNKIVYCNCDNPERSNFWKYFYDYFNELQLKELISTHYNPNESSYALTYDGILITKTTLKGNGDFRSDECINYLKQSDLVVTNPPFSLAREFIKQLIDYNKKFIIVGNKNWITYKNAFLLFKNQQIWKGINDILYFIQPHRSFKKFGNICWFTNLPVEHNAQKITFKEWNNTDYPIYDTYPAFEVAKVSNLPFVQKTTIIINSDMLDLCKQVYKNDLTVLSKNDQTAKININRPILGVPITFIEKDYLNSMFSKYFEVVGLDRYVVPRKFLVNERLSVNSKTKYARALIRLKSNINRF